MGKGKFWVDRELFSNSIFTGEKANDTSAWLDLVGLASFKPSYVKIRDIRVELKRGEIGHSLEFYATRWKWSKGKVRRYFEHLEHCGMIKYSSRSSTITTIILIVNYDKYQSNGTTNKFANSTANEDPNNTKSSRAESITNGTQLNKDKIREINIVNKINVNNDNEEPRHIKEDLYIKILDKWNSLKNNHTSKVVSLTKSRITTLNARLNGCQNIYRNPLEAFEEICNKITSSDYLNGRERGGKHADWDWVMESDERWLHILEGKFSTNTKAKDESTKSTPLATKPALRFGSNN